MATVTNNLDNITVHWDNDDSDHDNDGDTTGEDNTNISNV
jgi:hypothetical protein